MALVTRNLALALRQEEGTGPGSFTVTIDCPAGNEYNGQQGLRISAIFVIFIGSMLGCIAPLLLSRLSKNTVLKSILFAAKFFGSGVIISTAFIHLLAPAIAALYSPCLDPDSAITAYAWPEGICLMSVFAMFFVELVVNHYVAKLDHDSQPALRAAAKPDEGDNSGGIEAGDSVEPAREGAKLVDSQSSLGKSFAMQLTALFILEFGIIFHSVLIGLTLAVSGEELVTLYIVLTFHQTFEGIGLGSRLAVVPWPAGKGFLAYVLSAAYSLSTPIALAVGLGVRVSFEPGSHRALVVSGVFDAVSAGILLYTGLVQLVAYDFFVPTRSQTGLGQKLGAFGWMCLGAGLMALLGNWA